MDTIDTLFMTKTTENPYPLGLNISLSPMCPYKGVPPTPQDEWIGRTTISWVDYQRLFSKGARAPSLNSLLGEERRSDSRKRRKSSLNNIWLHAFEEGRITLFLHAWGKGRTNRTLLSLENKTKIESGANYKTAAHAFVTATLQDCGLFWSPAMKTGATVVLEMCPKISNAFRRV